MITIADSGSMPGVRRPLWLAYLLSTALLVIVLGGCETFEGVGNARGGSDEPTLTDRTSVARAQEMLKELGYSVGSVDGIPGKRTAAATKAFQRSKRMRADGRVTAGLIAALRQENIGQNPGEVSAGVTDAQRRDVRKGTTTGAVAGAAIGALSARKLGLGTAEAAALGGLAGGVGGNVVGNKSAAARGEYAQENARLDEEFAARKAAIDRLNQRARQIARVQTERQQEIERLQRRISAGESTVEELKASLEELDGDIETNSRLARDLSLQIDLAKEDIQAIEAEMRELPDDSRLLAMRNELVDKRDELVLSMNTLNGITPELEQQRDALADASTG